MVLARPPCPSPHFSDVRDAEEFVNDLSGHVFTQKNRPHIQRAASDSTESVQFRESTHQKQHTDS